MVFSSWSNSQGSEMHTRPRPVSAPQVQVKTLAAAQRGIGGWEACHLIAPGMSLCAKPRPEAAFQGDSGGKRNPTWDLTGRDEDPSLGRDGTFELSLSLNQKRATCFKAEAVPWVCLCSLPSDV